MTSGSAHSRNRLTVLRAIVFFCSRPPPRARKTVTGCGCVTICFSRRTWKVYRARITSLVIPGQSPTVAAIRSELSNGLQGLLGKAVPLSDKIDGDGALVVLSLNSSVRRQARLAATAYRPQDRKGFKSGLNFLTATR